MALQHSSDALKASNAKEPLMLPLEFVCHVSCSAVEGSVVFNMSTRMRSGHRRLQGGSRHGFGGGVAKPEPHQRDASHEGGRNLTCVGYPGPEAIQFASEAVKAHQHSWQ